MSKRYQSGFETEDASEDDEPSTSTETSKRTSSIANKHNVDFSSDLSWCQFSTIETRCPKTEIGTTSPIVEIESQPCSKPFTLVNLPVAPSVAPQIETMSPPEFFLDTSTNTKSMTTTTSSSIETSTLVKEVQETKRNRVAAPPKPRITASKSKALVIEKQNPVLSQMREVNNAVKNRNQDSQVLVTTPEKSRKMTTFDHVSAKMYLEYMNKMDMMLVMKAIPEGPGLIKLHNALKTIVEISSEYKDCVTVAKQSQDVPMQVPLNCPPLSKCATMGKMLIFVAHLGSLIALISFLWCILAVQ